ncbi:DUF5367 family protein [Roseivirga misakiensis]|uniref:DUF5367 domain-containing protein n=1 Tax=Roseivirga misakiensis TaxID=1563681 RepID=A0A1E5T551_9BACT|nr:DUF5367 family protein [Roseivirga misakiensis]OEK06504.1 hypothetical protein BFP71_02180 [Roseivirga misakiensis]
MQSINLKKASLSALIIWGIGVSAFVGSYNFTILNNANEQANLFLIIALIPAIIIGVYFYNKKGTQTNGLPLAVYMFLVTILLDSVITVPLFIIPAGGDHLSFFLDPGFWILGIEYIILVIVANWIFSRKLKVV